MADQTPLDLDPAVQELKALIDGTKDDAFDRQTPCPDWTVGDLVDHVVGLTWAFTQTARKSGGVGVGGPPPQPSAANLRPGWRDQLPGQLDDLVAAWGDPAAYEGMAQAGGVTMPAMALGVVALGELTVHGWDLARATGQPFVGDPAAVKAITRLMSRRTLGAPSDGPFGPPVAVPAEASPLNQAIGLSGRDPAWRPATAG
jgi:uncharacterized protein (TIGR03086 family)